MDYSEDVHAELAARHYLYGLFQTLFGNEPGKQLFEAVDCGVAVDALSIVLPKGAAEVEVQRFVECLEYPAERLALMERDYTHAFVGPHELPAPPWESVYVSNNRLLFQASTLEVRAAYRSQGFLPSEHPHVADDHLALELDFLARLAGSALWAYAVRADGSNESEQVEVSKENNDASAKNNDVFEEAVGASLSFASNHLSIWVESFARDLVAWNRGSFYADAAVVLEAFVRADKEFLARLGTPVESV